MSTIEIILIGLIVCTFAFLLYWISDYIIDLYFEDQKMRQKQIESLHDLFLKNYLLQKEAFETCKTLLQVSMEAIRPTSKNTYRK